MTGGGVGALSSSGSPAGGFGSPSPETLGGLLAGGLLAGGLLAGGLLAGGLLAGGLLAGGLVAGGLLAGGLLWLFFVGIGVGTAGTCLVWGCVEASTKSNKGTHSGAPLIALGSQFGSLCSYLSYGAALRAPARVARVV